MLVGVLGVGSRELVRPQASGVFVVVVVIWHDVDGELWWEAHHGDAAEER